MASRILGKLRPSTSALFVCDVQEKFRPLIAGFPTVIDTTKRMVLGAKCLDIPVLVTEQYPKVWAAHNTDGPSWIMLRRVKQPEGKRLGGGREM